MARDCKMEMQAVMAPYKEVHKYMQAVMAPYKEVHCRI
jgi:hypothetical protein